MQNSRTLERYTTENEPDEPVKSRFQISGPGQDGKAGWSTVSTSGRTANHFATRSADSSIAIGKSSRT